ncbi:MULTISPECIES: hypothetical protein [unclassified Yoonia]|uniref:hypothetical protein n=1 Tax=unclassified Yoonia TaxID=2629118 RepID=UPI002B00241E|nr:MULTISPECIES: hypothetical protein [unclassified Yoonia]
MLDMSLPVRAQISPSGGAVTRDGASAHSDVDQATDLAVAEGCQRGPGKTGLIYAPVGRDKRHMLIALQQHKINERLKPARYWRCIR